MTAKMSKKELESPDLFQSSLERVSDYISENTVRFYVIIAAIVAAVIIAIGIYFYWNNYQNSAVDLYAKAQDYVAKNSDKPESAKESIKLFKELSDKYPHSWSSRMSRYNLGNIYYNQGEIDNAIAAYKDFISSSSSDTAAIKFLALSSLGYCYESKKDYKTALDYFEQALKSNTAGFESIAFSNVGRIYEELNDKKKALENYQLALQKTADSSTALFIKRKISSLN
jgi:predicted negative regulator of RcsB-dependent stress response